MANSLQDEYANALEALRNQREENARLERELERAQHLLFLAENPQAGVTLVPADQVDDDSEGFDALPFIPDQE